MLLEDNSWLLDQRKRDADDYDATRRIVSEVQAFGDAAATNAHEDGAALLSLEDVSVVELHHLLVLH